MTDPLVQRRRKAIDSAKASNTLSGFEPSDFGLSVFERWVSGECTAQQAVDAVKGHYRHRANTLADQDSDMHAKENLLDLTDSRQLRLFEADVTTIRMA